MVILIIVTILVGLVVGPLFALWASRDQTSPTGKSLDDELTDLLKSENKENPDVQ